jgi:hypothetical protein
MFKTWQIFVFSLIPLALVFAGVIIGSLHGSDSEAEVFPTAPAPAATPRSYAGPDGGLAPIAGLVWLAKPDAEPARRAWIHA